MPLMLGLKGKKLIQTFSKLLNPKCYSNEVNHTNIEGNKETNSRLKRYEFTIGIGIK